ncbi:MAG: hypothetical protein ACK4JY_00510 [Brevundimonas sp.]
MALNHPVDQTPSRDGPHPAVCLLAGFGVIIGCATLVHVIFNVLV